MKSALFATVAALALWGAAAPASATTYDFSFSTTFLISGSAVSASGTFTVPDGDTSLTAASGMIDGSSITGFDPSSVFLSTIGLLDASFTTASGVDYSFDAGTYSSSAGDEGRAADFTATAVSGVPLPASLPLFSVALLGLGILGYGSKRNRKVRHPLPPGRAQRDDTAVTA